jgi:hypothetical protein
MEIEQHPSAQLQSGWINTIREYAAAAEKAGKLLPEQLALVYQQQWFKMLVPKAYGGMELSLPDEVRLIEALSWADGSMGWAVTLCSGAGWFGGFLDAPLSCEIFADNEVCLAGSGAPGGTALLTDSGYLINGHWKYASGALHATHFTANCIIHDHNGLVLDADGKPEIRPFIFDKRDVKVLPAWNYTGMVATGSHSFEVTNLQVGKYRCFKIDPDFAIVPKPLYQYPFLQLAEATLAVNISGMAINFIDLCEFVFAEKISRKDLSAAKQNELQTALNDSVVLMNLVRGEFYKAVDTSWLDYAGDDKIHAEPNLLKVSAESRALGKAAIKIVDTLYPYCGLIAASTSSDINRVWRDIHTASQHALLTFAEK